ncbi:flavodoxin family protein [Salinimicrobium soli]|uniref:flavodoxin family protein n=1 Tax=Salinimicrobium soli TaxID=1254399 RepID=UPI003AAAEF78
MEKKGVIILGSSRSNGNTAKVSEYIAAKTRYDILDLTEYQIGPYHYENIHQHDDFLPLMRRIAETYDTIIFATPVYWYSMSGTMKIFFDRITDCLKIEKETGRKLRGKTMAMLSCGSDSELKPGFEMPFRESANYLGMKYAGEVHTWIENNEIPLEVEQQLEDFLENITSTTFAVDPVSVK